MQRRTVWTFALSAGAAAMVLAPLASAKVTLSSGAVLVGESQTIVVRDSDGDLPQGTAVEFDPIVALEDSRYEEGEIICVVIGVSAGIGSVVVHAGDDVEPIVPGIVCFATPEELAGFLDSLLAIEMAELGEPAAGPLRGARVLVARILDALRKEDVSAVEALIDAAVTQVLRAERLSGRELRLLIELLRIFLLVPFDEDCEVRIEYVGEVDFSERAIQGRVVTGALRGSPTLDDYLPKAWNLERRGNVAEFDVWWIDHSNLNPGGIPRRQGGTCA